MTVPLRTALLRRTGLVAAGLLLVAGLALASVAWRACGLHHQGKADLAALEAERSGPGGPRDPEGLEQATLIAETLIFPERSGEEQVCEVLAPLYDGTVGSTDRYGLRRLGRQPHRE